MLAMHTETRKWSEFFAAIFSIHIFIIHYHFSPTQNIVLHKVNSTKLKITSPKSTKMAKGIRNTTAKGLHNYITYYIKRPLSTETKSRASTRQ